MSGDPLDTVIGTNAGARDAAAATKHLETARKAVMSGDRVTAIAEFRKAVASDPTNADALFGLAYQLDLVGEEEESLSLYERAASRQPAHLNALINLAIMYEDRGDLVRSERCLRQVLDTEPNHPRARLYMKDVMGSKEMQVEEEADRDIFKKRALLDTPVTDFELSVRARTCLKKMNIRTLGDLTRVTESQLLASKNFGETSLDEIKEMLTAKGLRLGQALEEGARYDPRFRSNQPQYTPEEQAAMNKPISELNFSVRARKCMNRLTISTVGELIQRTADELLEMKNFGQTSLVEVREKLVELNLKLRGD